MFFADNLTFRLLQCFFNLSSVLATNKKQRWPQCRQINSQNLEFGAAAQKRGKAFAACPVKITFIVFRAHNQEFLILRLALKKPNLCLRASYERILPLLNCGVLHYHALSIASYVFLLSRLICEHNSVKTIMYPRANNVI